MRIIVQKFGGTSVATPALRAQVADKVLKAKADGCDPVVVVSAMGRLGEPYATDTLLNLARSVCRDGSPRELDLIASCGEIIASVVMCNTLRARGLAATALTGWQAGIITTADYTEAEIIRVEPDNILRCLKEGKTVVVAGFQGRAENGDVTTLGRGGSDTTAVALGAALGAEVVEIYTDVDGVKTADPRIVPEARTIEVMNYSEVFQLAHQGAKVIHSKAVEIAMRRNIPLRIRSTFSDSPGTLITSSAEAGGWPGLRGKIITGVTYILGVAQVKVHTPDSERQAELELAVFDALADAGVSVDLINVSPELKMFIIKGEQIPTAEARLKALGVEYEIVPRRAKVSIVGAGMRGVPGVMARVVRALSAAGVRILQTADSHLTISCLVAEEDVNKAVRALHDQFGLNA